MIRTTFVGLVLLICTTSNSLAAQFIGIGDFPDGAFNSDAQGISADGAAVVGTGNRFDDPSGTSDAFMWKQSTGIINLETFPRAEPRTSYAQGVSGNGNVVVGRLRYESAMGIEAFRWSSATGIVGIGFLPGGAFATSFAEDASADGGAIVGASSSVNSLSEAFVWMSDTGMVGLADLPGGDFHSYATGISADGQVIAGGATSASGSEAFRWTAAEGMTPLGELPGGFFGSGARAISSDGTTIVGYSNSESSAFSSEAFRWTESTGMQPLGDLPGGVFTSDALAVSADGSVVLGYSDREDDYHAFAWDSLHGIRDLQEVLASEFGLASQLANWRLISATDISDDGLSIAGFGINPDGRNEAWLVRLDHPLNVPEPQTTALVAFAAMYWGCRLATGRCSL